MKDVFEYDAFLSFADPDEKIARPIWQEMSLSGLRVFWSDESLKQNIGQSFFTVIQNALTHSRHFVLICTPNAMTSHWVREEYETFFSQCYIPSGRERRLILFPQRNFDKARLPTLLRNIQMCGSVKEIITTLGGVNKTKASEKRSREIHTDKIQDMPSTDRGDFNPVVDAKKCEGCEECVDVCPVDVFEMIDGKAVPVNGEQCIGCESCIEICEPKAINIENA